MPFRCPQCKTPNTLEITISIELPPDRESGEIVLQVVCCSACRFQGLAVYEEGRGGSFEVENWSHIGYWVSPDAVESVVQAIRQCPDPRDPHCQCASHIALGKREKQGLWKGLMEMQTGHTFWMRLVQ